MIFNTAKIMSKGQITLPVDIRRNMRLSTGDRVVLIYENDRVILMNPDIYANEFNSSVKEILLKEKQSGSIPKGSLPNAAKGFGALAHRANPDLWEQEEGASVITFDNKLISKLKEL